MMARPAFMAALYVMLGPVLVAAFGLVQLLPMAIWLLATWLALLTFPRS